MKALRRIALVTMFLSLLVASAVEAQPPVGGRGRGGPGGPRGMFGGVVGLVQQEEVRREIQLSDSQQEELRTLGEAVRDEIQGEMGDMFRGMRGLSDEERQTRFDEIRTRFDKINKDVEARLQKVLLPHQFDRLKQIDLQARLERGGASALTEGELAETLGLTDSQREQLEERARDVQKDLEAKVQQLRLDARNQLFDVLTTEQRAKLESMMGEQFALPEPDFGRRGRDGPFGFGGRAGRGGRGPGGNQDARPAGE